MTRITTLHDGKKALLSFSYFGPGGEEAAAAAFKSAVDKIKEYNRKIDSGEIKPEPPQQFEMNPEDYEVPAFLRNDYSPPK